jgi:hypothetical protein
LDDAALSAKLNEVRATTELKYGRRWVCSGIAGKTEQTCGWRDAKEEWAVAYGRLEAKKLHSVRVGPNEYRGIGFGHLAAAPVQLVIKQKNLRTIPEGQSAMPVRP